MSGCNCKNKNNELIAGQPTNKEGIIGTFFKYLVKIFGFSVALILIPVIVLYIVWVMFDIIILNNNVDLRNMLNSFLKISKRFSDDDDDDDDDDDYILTEEDVVMLNVEDITNKMK